MWTFKTLGASEAANLRIQEVVASTKLPLRIHKAVTRLVFTFIMVADCFTVGSDALSRSFLLLLLRSTKRKTESITLVTHNLIEQLLFFSFGGVECWNLLSKGKVDTIVGRFGFFHFAFCFCRRRLAKSKKNTGQIMHLERRLFRFERLTVNVDT